MSHAHGPFDVKIAPQPPDVPGDTAPPSRMTLDKHYHGDLEGGGKGQMLAARTAGNRSGAYVAIEQVSATLQGRRGTFVLAHRGIMDDGAQHLEVSVVPGSGTGELTGIAGTMTIEIAPGGAHSYGFDYALPAASGAPGS